MHWPVGNLTGNLSSLPASAQRMLKGLARAAVVGLTLSACATHSPTMPNGVLPSPTLAATQADEREAYPAKDSPTHLPTPTSVPSPTPTWPAPIYATPTLDPPRDMPTGATLNATYTVRRGDTLSGIAIAVGTTVEELLALNNLRNPDRLMEGQTLTVALPITGQAPSIKLIPDSELVNGPSAVGFDVEQFVASRAGYLARHLEKVNNEWLTGAQIVVRVSEQHSVNPRLLIALLEYVGGWLDNPQPSAEQRAWPMGYRRTNLEGLYIQLVWAAARLNEGYYGWRLNNRLWVRLDDDTRAFMGNGINAGTAGLQNYLAAIHTRATWLDALGEAPGSFIQTYRRLFGNPWQYDIGPIVPAGVTQPELSLPWPEGETWLFTGGPHSAWGKGTPWGALDFTPQTVQGCANLREWVTAVADGVITRSRWGEVVLSLDPSGDDRIGWSVLYLHIHTQNRVAVGTRVKRGDRIGHPSCEGGVSSGAHVHLARRYNGEWLNAVGEVPFELGGWTPSEGSVEYDGTLTKGNLTREACECKQPNLNGVSW
ncbi:MAG: LysM peptidoglycan-binding domain-containing protein [Anaerolineae bacterium]|nr:LysM peptidoglycan-binding domain-containing protein [Thermoflexales bacterium]MDW8407137.1 LysM peptidoglycan-binding domain-containing protein [Anaerolineae bacterium]